MVLVHCTSSHTKFGMIWTSVTKLCCGQGNPDNKDTDDDTADDTTDDESYPYMSAFQATQKT